MTSAFEFDAFISYNRNDRAFASRLERDVERFAVPKSLRASRRRLKVFRDTDDMTGTDYGKAIRRHLDASRKLIVVCSPNARESNFVNDEINYFIEGHSPEAVVPVMLEGIPNNETNDESMYTFPPALQEAMGMPLGIDYRSWQTGALSRRKFRDQWYTLLAELLDTSRDQIEQRDLHQKTVRRSLAGGLAAIVLSVTGFLAWRWLTTQVEVRAAEALDTAVRRTDVRERAVALSELKDLPEPAGLLQAILTTAQALSDSSTVREIGYDADMSWSSRESGAIVSDEIMPLLGSTLNPDCSFEQPPKKTLTGLVSPDGELQAYLYQDRLFVQRADNYGIASVYCLDIPPYRDTSSGAEEWRMGIDTLDGRIGFANGPDGPEVLVKDINNKMLHKVPAYRPGVRTLWLTKVDDAEFGPEGDLLVTHRGQSAGRVKLLARDPGDDIQETSECFVYRGSEKKLSEILAYRGHTGFDDIPEETYSDIRGCYLDDRQVIAVVSQELMPTAKVLAIHLKDLRRIFHVYTNYPDCTAFGQRSLSYCEGGDTNKNEYIREAGVVQFDNGSAQRLPLDDENWHVNMHGNAVESADGKKLLIWGTPPPTISANSPAVIWLDDEMDRPPFLIDNSPSQVTKAAFSPDGQYLYVLREDGTLKLWSFESEALLTEFAERVADQSSDQRDP